MPRNPDRNLGLLAVVILVAAIGFGGITLRASAESHWQSGEENTPTPTGTLEPEASASSTPMSTATDSPDDPASPTPTLTSTNPPTETAEHSPTASPTAVEPSREPTATTPWYEDIVTPTPMPAEEAASQSSFGPQSFSTTSESTDLIIDDGPEDAYRPQVAFNPDAGVYLVVWQTSDVQAETGIYARYLSGDGQPMTSSILILEGIEGPVQTKLSYGGDSFLLVYRVGSNDFSADLYSLVLSSTPQADPVDGTPSHLHSPVARQFDVAYREAPEDGEFVVVFIDGAHRVLAQFLRGEVFGLRVAPSGEVQGSTVNVIARPFVFSIGDVINSPAFQVDLSLAYNPSRDEFFLTYGIYDCTLDACVIREELRGRLLDGESLLIDSQLRFITPNVPAIQWGQRVAYNPETQEYLTVWADNRVDEFDFNLLRQRVSQFAVLEGGNEQVVATSGSQVEPELVALEGVAPQPSYALSYQDEPISGAAFAMGARLDALGALQEPPFSLSDDANSTQAHPQIIGSDDAPLKWLAVWEHVRPFEDSDIHGRFFETATGEELPAFDLISPVDWTMVLSLRPTFTWESLESAERYRLTIFHSTSTGTPGGTATIPFVLPADSVKVPDLEGTSRYRPDFELSSGDSLASGGYFWQVTAFDSGGSELGSSAVSPFQIPPIGPAWDTVKQDRTFGCSGFCEFSALNPYWYAYDDEIYRWAEYYEIPPSLFKAVMMAETSTGLGMRDVGGELFPPHMAYLYEPGQDYRIHYNRSIYPNPDPMLDLFRVPENPPPSDNCKSSDGGPCPYPYDHLIPDDPTIYAFAFRNDLGGEFSNLDGAGHPLVSLPGCQNLFDASDCVADEPGVNAEFRIVASYGLGQNFYVIQHNRIQTVLGSTDEIAPEELYDPALATRMLGDYLARQRCNRGLNHNASTTDLSLWSAILLDYNGGKNKDYDGQVISRSIYTQPRSLISGLTPGLQLESSGPTCPTPIGPPADHDNHGTGLLSLQEPDVYEIARVSVDLTGDGSPEGVILQSMVDSGSGASSGRILIYENGDFQGTPWSSGVIENVHPFALLEIAGDPPGRVPLVHWGAGAHAFRTYPILWNGTEFSLATITDETPGNYIGSDGGGTYAFADGSLVALQRDYIHPEHRIALVYEPVPAGYSLVRRLILDPESTDSSPPDTTLVISGEAGDGGWYSDPVSVELTAVDDTEILFLTYSLLGPGVDRTVVSPLGEVALKLEEGVWTLSFHATDIAGNAGQVQVVTIMIDTTPPSLSATASPGILWPPNGRMIPVTVEGVATDTSSGIDRIEVEIFDEYGTWQPAVDTLLADGEPVFSWSIDIALEARRDGGDKDGRLYTIHVTAFDIAGNPTNHTVSVLAPHDMGNKGKP